MRLLLLLGLLGLAPVARAAPVNDRLAVAADNDLPEAQRMEAFNRLVMDFPTIRPQLEQLASADDADARQRWIAIRVMGQSGRSEAKAPLLALCDDPMPAIRAAAASALGDLGDKSTSTRLAELLWDPAIIVRAAAAEALGKVRDVRSAPELERAIADRSNFYRGSSLWVRAHYVRALGDIGARSSIPALISCLDDGDPAVGQAALEALRAINGFDFAEGRTDEEHREAWRRWAASEGPF
ncbi:MAG: HEAT repeat domain-containing protein [Alphaproteobacteria bacterium]|nr:HEAT repeat domain-containing protein [Alphaproteobacteria bacterium]